MQPRKLLVFDLETVPDLALARALWPEAADMDDAACREHILATFKERNGGRSDFPAPPFHQIVAIGCLLADIEPMEGGSPGHMESYHFKKLGCIGTADDNEESLVRQWFDYAAGAAGHGAPLRLVSFNGRGFDLPVLKLRALKYGLDARWLFQSGDKWSNYGSRYDNTWHADMADILADYGASRGATKLDEVCTLIGLPGKLDTHGAHVAHLVAEGKLQAVRDYCETDILNTYVLYLRWQRLNGTLSPEALAKEENAVREMLEKQSQKAGHLKQFLANWPQPA